MNDIAAIISELDALDAKRTKGPWRLGGASRCAVCTSSGIDSRTICRMDEMYDNDPADTAAFIVALENKWPILRAMLSAQHGWMPIETAPKETDVLLYNELWEDTFGAIQIGQIDHGGEWNFQSGMSLADTADDEDGAYEPTHWKPLEPPALSSPSCSTTKDDSIENNS